MKRMKMSLQAVLVLLVLLCTPILTYASNYREVAVSLDGKANEIEFAEGVLCSFTPTADGTLSISCTAETTVKFLAIKKYANGNYNFSTWVESGVLSAGETAAKDYHVTTGQKYAIEIEGTDDGALCKATLSLSLKPDPTVTSISFGKSEYTVANDDRLDFPDLKVLPEDAVDKELEWIYDKNGFYYYPSSNSFLAKESGVYTLTAKAPKSGVSASVKVIVTPKQVINVRQDTQKTTQKEILVEWNTIDEAKIAGYNVFQYDSAKKKWKLCGTTKKNKYRVTKLKTESKYKFKVTAFVKDGSTKIEGEASKPVTLYTAPKKIAATSITSIKTFGGTTNKNYVTVSWKKVKGATGYRIYGKSKDGKFKALDYTTSTSGSFYAGRGYTYGFRVVAYRTSHGVTTNAKPSATKNYKSE